MKCTAMVVEAYFELIFHDLFISTRDFAALHAAIRAFTLRPRTPRLRTRVIVCQALDVACALYPKQALCLQRSAVLVRMLRRRGIAASLVIGVQKIPFKAHAWVEVAGEVINDRVAIREKFLVMEVC